MINLRPYQQKSIDLLYDWLGKNNGNPCMVLPTGAGKSVVIAEFVKSAVQSWPNTRVLMLTHVKELIEQNSDKMRKIWPNAPFGIYSASLGRRELSEPITFAGIQSIHRRAYELGHVDLVLIDECHTVGHKDEGIYRDFLRELATINPSIRIIGFTATPYRLGHGLITDKPAIFDDILEPTTIVELQALGFLAKLRSKDTKTHFDLAGVHKRGGEYIESELQAAVDTNDNNQAVCTEIILRAEGRKSWLLFCAGVDHSHHVAEILRNNGVSCETVTGDTPKQERDRILQDFKAGKITAITNANVLTTGFDAPNVDLIAFLRPTESHSLYVQMAGRGFRLKDHTDHCLILDFAGLIERHGPITGINIESKNGEEKEPGVPPSKICPQCDEIILAQVRICPACEYEFPPPEKKELVHHNDDIMGQEALEMVPTYWDWQIQKSRKSGLDMLVCTYYSAEPGGQIKEYFCLWHGGFVAKKALELLKNIATNSGVYRFDDTRELSAGRRPDVVKYRKDGKFNIVLDRVWTQKIYNDEVPF